MTVSPVLLAGVLAGCSSSGSATGVHFQGQPITDEMREDAVEGDGRAPESSIGIWQGTLNLIENGGFETDAAGWVAEPASSLDVVGEGAKFGESAARVSVSGGEPTRLVIQNINGSRLAAEANLPYALSVWSRSEGGAGRLELGVRWYDRQGNLIGEEEGTTAIALSETWERYSGTFASPEDAWDAEPVLTVSGGSLRLDGAQLEQHFVATPYVETDGFRASREAADVTFSAAALDETQGWVALRLRPGWSTDGNEPGGGSTYPRLIEWGNGGPDRISVFYGEPLNVLGVHRRAADQANEITAAASFDGDGAVTVIAAWTLNGVGLSINGEPFTEDTGEQAIPDLTSFGDVSIGSRGANEHINGDVLWLAAGVGTLTDEDAAALHARGNGDAEEEDLPEVAGLTVLWRAD